MKTILLADLATWIYSRIMSNDYTTLDDNRFNTLIAELEDIKDLCPKCGHCLVDEQFDTERLGTFSIIEYRQCPKCHKCTIKQIDYE